MKYYAYHYPDCNDKDVKIIQSLRMIVRARVKIAELLYSGYPTANDALLDHIAINWAYECKKDGSRILGVE